MGTAEPFDIAPPGRGREVEGGSLELVLDLGCPIERGCWAVDGAREEAACTDVNPELGLKTRSSV